MTIVRKILNNVRTNGMENVEFETLVRVIRQRIAYGFNKFEIVTSLSTHSTEIIFLAYCAALIMEQPVEINIPPF